MLSKKLLTRSLVHDFDLYLMVLVPVLFIGLFSYVPMAGILIAFKKYDFANGYLNSIIFGKWEGLKYFRLLFQDELFWRAFKNTFVLSGYSLIIGFPLPIIVSILLNEIKNQKFKRTIQTISYFPHFISTVIIVGIVMQFLSPSTGIVNAVIKAFGGEPIYFLIKPEWFRTIYIASGQWQHLGWRTIIYMAAIAKLDPMLYEAAEIDGAGRFKRIRHITIPGILPTVIILLLINLGDILEVGFEKVLLLYNPLTYGTADVLGTLVYRRLGSYSYATAAGLFSSVVGFVFLIFANHLSRKYTEISLW